MANEKELKKELNRLTRQWRAAMQKNNRIQAQAIESRLRTVQGMIRNLGRYTGVSRYFAD